MTNNPKPYDLSNMVARFAPQFIAEREQSDAEKLYDTLLWQDDELLHAKAELRRTQEALQAQRDNYNKLQKLSEDVVARDIHDRIIKELNERLSASYDRELVESELHTLSGIVEAMSRSGETANHAQRTGEVLLLARAIEIAIQNIRRYDDIPF